VLRAVEPRARRTVRIHRAVPHCSRPVSRLPPLFFFNPTAPTDIYTLSLHDALPIYLAVDRGSVVADQIQRMPRKIRIALLHAERSEEHTSELQSQSISYAVFCLKKKSSSR